MSLTAPHEGQALPDAARPVEAELRGPLEQLLHALNQPLTGLQCSMEVALAGPRTVEYHVKRLQEALELTERMRALVEAIREVVDGGDRNRNNNKDEPPDTIDLKLVLREMVDDLQPVAEVKRVRIALDCAVCALLVSMGRGRLSSLVFRFLESALSLAEDGSALQVESGGGPEEVWICVRWRAGAARTEWSRPELGLLVAQAGWEQVGAQWERERTGDLETATVRLHGLSGERNS